MHDIFDRHAELRRHLLAEIDRHPGRNPPASFLVDHNAPPAGLIAIATRSLPSARFVPEGIGACGPEIMTETPRMMAGDARQGIDEHRILLHRLVIVELHRPLWSIAGSVEPGFWAETVNC